MQNTIHKIIQTKKIYNNYNSKHTISLKNYISKRKIQKCINSVLYNVLDKGSNKNYTNVDVSKYG